MLTAKILNSDATLNHFHEISNVEFIPGEQITVKLQLWDTQLNQRYIPPSTNTTTFTLNVAGGTTTTASGTHLTDDRSIVSFELSETVTATLLGGNIQFTLDILGDASQIVKGIILNALSRVLDGSEC